MFEAYGATVVVCKTAHKDAHGDYVLEGVCPILTLEECSRPLIVYFCITGLEGRSLHQVVVGFENQEESFAKTMKASPVGVIEQHFEVQIVQPSKGFVRIELRLEHDSAPAAEFVLSVVRRLKHRNR